MKWVLILVLFLPGCTTLKRGADWVCTNVEKVQSGVSDVFGFFGPPGNVIAGGINIALDVFCGAVDVVLNVPADAATDVGLGGTDEDEPAAHDPGSDPGQ